MNKIVNVSNHKFIDFVDFKVTKCVFALFLSLFWIDCPSLEGHGWKDIKSQNLQLQSWFQEILINISIYIKFPSFHPTLMPYLVLLLLQDSSNIFAKLSNYGKVQQANQAESFLQFLLTFSNMSFSPTIEAELEKLHTVWMGTPFFELRMFWFRNHALKS